jgi:DNA mismatch repair protein MutH
LEWKLKSSPLKQLKNNEYRSKERLVLNIINYFNVVNQNFENSDFIKKNAKHSFDFLFASSWLRHFGFIIKLVDEWSFPSTDLEIIKKDWETIKKKLLTEKHTNFRKEILFILVLAQKVQTLHQ